MSEHKILDLLGVGVGPFNLGLAALAEPLGLEARFIDAAEDFRWHPGMMLPGCHLQVPFLADLVTMADPTSKYSFLNYLRHQERLYPFYIREDFNILRDEYSNYCRWVIAELESVTFGTRLMSLKHDGQVYIARVEKSDGTRQTLYTRRIVLGIGTESNVPDVAHPLISSGVGVHSGDYLHEKEKILQAQGDVVLLGSGQSAAEIFVDLMQSRDWKAEKARTGRSLKWLTRSPRYFPLEYTKLTLEMTSPEYIDHFRGLSAAARSSLLRDQHNLYKGINGTLINEIYDELYRLSVGMSRAELDAGQMGIELGTNLELTASTPQGKLTLRHTETGASEQIQAGHVILATGYKHRPPTFLEGIKDRVSYGQDGEFNVSRDYAISQKSGEIFVQNAELHANGFTAPDLGMGAYRNSMILRTIQEQSGKAAPYPIPERIAFQNFAWGGQA